jgi:hypothetical protein
MAFERRITAKTVAQKSLLRYAKDYLDAPGGLSLSSGASNGTDFVMGRRTTSLHLVRAGPDNLDKMRLLPVDLTTSCGQRVRTAAAVGRLGSFDEYSQRCRGGHDARARHYDVLSIIRAVINEIQVSK